MSTRVEVKLAALEQLSTGELKAEWVAVMKTEPPRITAALMRLAIAYRVQERSLGGLSAKSRRRVSSPAASSSPIKPGTRLLRSWKGRTIEVFVTEDGYEYNGRSYRSLSRIAREVTGTPWSGRRFFGLNVDG